MTARSILPAPAGFTALGAIALLALVGCQDTYSPTEPLLDGPPLDLAVATLSTSTGVETQITTNTSMQESPAISGDRIVWRDYRDDAYPGDIYWYDISTGTEAPITTSHKAYSPDISGDRVVWVDESDYPDYGIHMYDFSTDTETEIERSTALEPYDLAISDDWIVWREFSDKNKLYVFDLSTNMETTITDDEDNPQGPAISGGLVVWSDDADVYMYDLSTGTETRITEDDTDQYYPVISGDRIVWWEPGTDWDGAIYMYEISTGTETQITTDEAAPAQRAPSIWGDWIAWMDDRNGDEEENPNADIYMYDISTGTETQITTDTNNQIYPDVSSDRIVWQDGRNIGSGDSGPPNWDIYMYDASVPSPSPDAMLQSLITEAQATDGVSKGTVNKLRDALKHWEADRTTAAVSNLEAFINDLESQAGKKVTEAEAIALIAAAQEIIDTILAAGP